MEKLSGSIRNIWMEGGKSYCLSLPLEIIKKLNITQNDRLYVELVDDLIVMKKHNIHLTKSEINKVKNILQQESSPDIITIKPENKENSNNVTNPLDGLDL